METALLVIDVQNDYFPRGRMELPGCMEASDRIRNIMAFFRNREKPVIHVQHVSAKPDASFFLPDTDGIMFHENTAPERSEKIIRKNFPNSFRGTDLDLYCQDNGIGSLVIVGMMTHMCVDATVRAAFDLGYDCLVLGDCCATRDLEFEDRLVTFDQVQESFLAAMNGTFARVMGSEEFMEQNSRH
jgi:nicotinamidase-related amidase